MNELKFYHEKAEQALKNIIKTMDKKRYNIINNGLWEDTNNYGEYIKRVEYQKRGVFDKIHLYIKHENASKSYASHTSFIFRFYEKGLNGLRLELSICDLNRTKINKIINI